MKSSSTNSRHVFKLGRLVQKSSARKAPAGRNSLRRRAAFHRRTAFLRRTALFGVALAAVCVAPDALAGTSRYPDFQAPFDFTLSLISSDIDLQTNDSQYSVSQDRISISVLTQVEPYLQLGFITGSSNLSLDNDPPTAGMHLSGYHAGLALHSIVGRNPQIGFHANYIYQETKDATANQTATLSWHQWAAGVSGTIILGQQLELTAGWAHLDVDAQRRATGTINETKNLRLTSAGQSQLAIAWRVSSGGHVALALQRGSYQQVEFRFSRQFR